MPTRRKFLKIAGRGTLAAGIGLGLSDGMHANAAGGTPPGAAEETKSGTQGAPSAARITEELPIPTKAEAPQTREYRCDVLVIGGGFAGLNAAVSAKMAGRSVLLVDKGRPGYSGLSPFVNTFRWFDKELGDDANAFRRRIQRFGEYIVNMDWYNTWLEESKQTYQRLKAWGILDQYPKAIDTGDYAKKQDFVGYREKFDEHDRHAKFIKVLSDNGIPYLARTMITDVIQQDGKIAGAMGFDMPSGAVLSFHARAVVMCTGGGCYKPSGYPTGSSTCDSEYFGYHLGLPIVGKEFDDFHKSASYAEGNAFLINSWVLVEKVFLCGGDISAQETEEIAEKRGNSQVQTRILRALGGLPNNDGSDFFAPQRSNPPSGMTLSNRPDDPRTGWDNTPYPKGDSYGAAVGMSSHLSSGIFCGLDDLVGYTGLPGLYVAGDGANGAAAAGACYSNGVGFTSGFCSLQGWRAGQAAAKYADGVPLKAIGADKVAEVSKEIQAPLHVQAGLDPNWARDVLQALMAPYWIHIVKSESTLRGALAQVEYMRDNVVPKLMAASTHDLRLCHEMKHKVLSAEMKLRAGLERKESRGLHYRSDYPYRDDSNFLCYIAIRKGKDGSMALSKIDIKDDWKGDLKQDYGKRYGWRFPGEAKAKGLPEESQS